MNGKFQKIIMIALGKFQQSTSKLMGKKGTVSGKYKKSTFKVYKNLKKILEKNRENTSKVLGNGNIEI